MKGIAVQLEKDKLFDKVFVFMMFLINIIKI